MKVDLISVFDKISTVDGNLKHLIGKIDATLPNLATKTDLLSAISKHESDCKKHRIRKKIDTEKIKLLTKIALGISGLTGAVYAVIKLLQ